jgi:hypothetical protein
MTYDPKRFHGRRLYEQRQLELEFMALVAAQLPQLRAQEQEDILLKELCVPSDGPDIFTAESSTCSWCTWPLEECLCPVTHEQRLINPPENASWIQPMQLVAQKSHLRLIK